MPRMFLHPFCPGCGTELTEEGSITVEFNDTEWGDATGRVNEEGLLILGRDALMRFGSDWMNAEPLPAITCTDCGERVEEAI